MLRTLLDRRRMVANYWLSKVDALSEFSIRSTAEGVGLDFNDLLVDQKLVSADSASYSYQVRGGGGYTSPKRTVKQSEIRIDRETLAAAIERGAADSQVEVRIWANRQGADPAPVRVYFDWSPGRDSFAVRRISRG
jgi:hypothetical protein